MTSKEITILDMDDLGLVTVTCKCGAKLTLQPDAQMPLSCGSCRESFPRTMVSLWEALAKLRQCAGVVKTEGFGLAFEIED